MRGNNSEFKEMSSKYPGLLKERDNAVQQVTRLKERVVLAEQRAVTAEKCVAAAEQRVTGRDTLIKTLVSPVKKKNKKHAQHTWLLVAKVLGFEDADMKTISKASKHMHDTLSRDWNQTLRKRSSIVSRLRCAGKILLTHLFSCVRVNKITVPVEDIISTIFQNVNNGQRYTGGEALESIRRAVHNAVSERRVGDAKMLLTLGISSFIRGKGSHIQSMRKYFTHIEPILVGSKVTFLTPNDKPTICSKKIENRNYSYSSKSVSRGTVVSVSDNRKELQVRYHPPGVEKPIVTKVPFAHAHNSSNIYINDGLVEAATQYKQHLGVGVPPVQTPSVQNHVISFEVRKCQSANVNANVHVKAKSKCKFKCKRHHHHTTGFKAFYILDIFATKHGSPEGERA